MGRSGLRACYPGSFDPPTVAHVAVAEGVASRPGIDEVHLVLSVDPLGKPSATPLVERVQAVVAVTAHVVGVRVTTTAERLLVDVAAGYDLLVLGADKWAQIQEVHWYGSVADRDAALARLPPVVVVPRAGAAMPDGVEVVTIDPAHAAVSSTAVRSGLEAWRARPTT